eukprot:TRINITY_DN514_c0_g1_i1.p1 TRINITY_DN514_c0_g1~~TRINITY_DN514_c0_g1_i1.p1  ORF type:complete len:263 (-),score=47.98 TRINITY_DN514_c0_g1_i1:425-1213(-)
MFNHPKFWPAFSSLDLSMTLWEKAFAEVTDYLFGHPIPPVPSPSPSPSSSSSSSSTTKTLSSSSSQAHLDGQSFSVTNSHLLSSGEFSDVAIKLDDGTSIQCHCSILARNPVLYKMLTSGMRESRDKVIEVHDTTPATFHILLEFIYTCTLSSKSGGMSKEDLLELIDLANMYQEPNLVSMCDGLLMSKIKPMSSDFLPGTQIPDLWAQVGQYDLPTVKRYIIRCACSEMPHSLCKALDFKNLESLFNRELRAYMTDALTKG